MNRLLAFALVLGCSSPAEPAVDAAFAPDASSVDASDGLCGFPSGVSFPQLPSACLPRCNRASRDVFQRCGVDLNCFFNDASVTNDDTAHAFLGSGTGPVEIGCGRSATAQACVDWQANSCVYDACPNEFDRRGRCTGDCAAAQQALVNCFNRSQATYRPCFNLRVPGCFPLD